MKHSRRLAHIKVALRLLGEIALNGYGLFNVFEALHKRSNQKPRIAFQAYSPHLAQFYRPIIRALRATDPEIEIGFIVLIHPQLPLDTASALKRYAHRVLGIPRRRIHYFHSTLWRSYDLLICNDMYARFPIRVSKKLYMAHGICATRRDIICHPARKTMFDFALALYASRTDIRRLTESYCGRRRLPRMLATGLPFLDRVNKLAASKMAYGCRLNLNPARPTVLIAPHWRNLDADYFNQVIGVLLNLEVNLVVKLHAVSHYKQMVGDVDWPAKLAAIEKAGGVAVDRADDDLPALAHADLLVTTLSSSRAFVGMLLDKPVILYPGREKETDRIQLKRHRLMRRGAYAADSVETVRSYISSGRWRRENPERAKVAEVCCDNFGTATDAVVRVIRAALKAPGNRPY